MAEDDQESKTEEATGKRIEQTRGEGNVLQSQEVKSASTLVGILVVIWMFVPDMGLEMRQSLGKILEHAGTLRIVSVDDLHQLSLDLVISLVLVLLKPLLLLATIGVLSPILQSGWVVSTKKLVPNLSKLNPLNGLKRMFSMQGLVEMAKNIAKIALVGCICTMVLRPHLRDLESMATMTLTDSLLTLHHILVRLIFSVLLAVITLAALDWFWQKHSYYKKLRMTKQEVKDENKQSEGDPVIKGRIRGLRMQRARARMMAAVPKADVVVTNPTHYACALKYDQASMNAPVLIAKGQDLVALRIRQLAEENDIPIVENPPLARALYATVELDREIPPEHYKAVAEVITYVMGIKGKFRR